MFKIGPTDFCLKITNDNYNNQILIKEVGRYGIAKHFSYFQDKECFHL